MSLFFRGGGSPRSSQGPPDVPAKPVAEESKILQDKSIPFTEAECLDLASRYPTPFHVYDEDGLRATCRRIRLAFAWHGSAFTNFFAVKACPNPYLLQVMKEEGFGVDCSSMGELLLAEACGFRGDQIMFTSNSTPMEAYHKAIRLGAFVNLDDISHLDYLAEYTTPPPSIDSTEQRKNPWLCSSSSRRCPFSAPPPFPDFISFRYNPGERREGNVIIGDPKDAKFGLTQSQLFDAYMRAKALGSTRFGLHAMVVSNCRDVQELRKTAEMLFMLAAEIKNKCGVRVEMIDLGGGMGVAYSPSDPLLDVEAYGAAVRQCYEKILVPAGLANCRIVLENGRFITGPHGYIFTRVIHQKNTYKNFIAVDACMADLMRPGMYGAYHHITFLRDPSMRTLSTRKKYKLPLTNTNLFAGGKKDYPPDTDKTEGVYDVVGGLCENNDKFAVDRPLTTPPSIGDLAVIHDTGAHGHSMGFQYNAKLRHAELLLSRDQAAAQQEICRNLAKGTPRSTPTSSPLKVKIIRRSETYADYFATLTGNWPSLSGRKTSVATTAATFGFIVLATSAAVIVSLRIARK